tara:strand:- start:59 stop:853 length:795 start_codon:yes stop_codon:yes gene_type:complete
MEKSLPLLDKTIILTRAITQQKQARKLFESLGAKVLELPSLVIGPPDEWGPLDDALDELDSFHWLIFSSSNGVQYVENRLRLKDSSLADSPKNLKIAVIGRKTADYLNQLGVKPDFIPPQFLADSLIDNFPVSGAGLKMLIPRVQSGGRTLLAESFGQSGAHVVEVAAYESICPKTIPELTANALENYAVDAITFTSSKTVSHTFQLINDYFGDKWQEKLNLVKLISIGPQTSLSCKKYFRRIDREAENHDMDGLIKACLDIIL